MEYEKYDKGDADCYLCTADALFALGRFNEAKDYLNKVKQIEPDNREAGIGLACIDIVADYTSGRRSGLPGKIMAIAKEDKGWATTLCKALPELQTNRQIKDFLNLI